MSEDELSIPVPELSDNPAPRKRIHARVRWLLLLLHIVVLFLAIFLAPNGYAFQLGASTGPILVFGSMGLWAVLFLAQTRRGLLSYCLLALLQVGIIASVALHYRAEDRVLREVMSDYDRQEQAWAASMNEFSMEPLYRMLNGERPVTFEELEKINALAKGGQAHLLKLRSETEQWKEQAISRVSKISARGALDVRRGMETRQAEEDDLMHALQAMYSEDEQLAEFLIQREEHYRVKDGVFEFESAKDNQTFDDRVASIAKLNEKLGTLVQNAKQKTEQLRRDDRR